ADRMAEERQYLRNDAEEALVAFRRRRAETLDLFARLAPRQWEKSGIHPVRGRFTIDAILSVMAWHDDNHLAQLIRPLEGRGKPVGPRIRGQLGIGGLRRCRYYVPVRSVIVCAAVLLLLVGSSVSAQPPTPSETREPQPPEPQPPAPEAKPPDVMQLPPVRVIGTTPIPSLGVPLDKYPGNAQRVTTEDIKDQNLVNLSEHLFRNFGSVNTIGAQGHSWQSDLTYRGFLGGPPTGSPIGASVYLDGMRFNDGFGDTINWDLIPQLAISTVDIIPGSNPLFGLNTLGGALSVRTKRGFDNPGFELGVSGGSWGRWAVEGEYGGSPGAFAWFLGLNVLNENGWRDESPSQLRQAFAKVGYRTAQSDFELSYMFANNQLVGNRLAPESLLAIDRRAVYTFPDETRNLMNLVNLR